MQITIYAARLVGTHLNPRQVFGEDRTCFWKLQQRNMCYNLNKKTVETLNSTREVSLTLLRAMCQIKKPCLCLHHMIFWLKQQYIHFMCAHTWSTCKSCVLLSLRWSVHVTKAYSDQEASENTHIQTRKFQTKNAWNGLFQACSVVYIMCVHTDTHTHAYMDA
jgi:hypothetical protein